MPNEPMTDEKVDELAREALAHRRSVIRALAGLPVRGLVGERIRKVLAARGMRVAQ